MSKVGIMVLDTTNTCIGLLKIRFINILKLILDIEQGISTNDFTNFEVKKWKTFALYSHISNIDMYYWIRPPPNPH